MNAAQLLALKTVVRTQEQLQAAWDNPGRYKFGKKFLALVVTVVVEEAELKWMSAIRLVHWKGKRQIIKPRATWSLEQRAEARRVIIAELAGVGDDAKATEFDSSKAMHLEKGLTADEKNLVLRTHILGEKANGHKPKVTTKAGAMAMLDGIEKDLNENTEHEGERRIILPGEQ